jgi:cytochrome c oxidase cbb3-type subunit 3
MRIKKLKYLKNITLFSVFMFLSGFAGTVFAQSTEIKDTSLDTYAKVVGWLFLLAVLVMFVLIIVYGDDKYKYSGVRKKSPALAKLGSMLTRSVPLEQEKDIMFEHDFDGITELDNKVPPWFSILFYGTIVFAVIYMLVFHVFKISPLMIDEYVEEIRAAEIQKQEFIKSGAFVNEETVTLLTEPASLQNGKTIYITNCVPCHGTGGEGTVGPNLTDDYWIHGGGIKNIFKTVKYGLPAKGMISWQTLLNPKQMQEVSSYITTLHGTNPPNGKPPEGNLYESSDSLKTNDSLKTKVKTPGDSIKTNTNKIDTVKTDTSKAKTK